MDHERAETFLRGFAEVQLRRAPLDDRPWARWKVSTLGNALVRVGALDAEVAEAIDDDIELALVVREPGPGGPRPRPRGPQTHAPMTRPAARTGLAKMHRISTVLRRPPGAAGGGPPRHQSAADVVVPLDLRIPVGSGQDRCMLHLLAFFRSGADAWFPVHLRPTGSTIDDRFSGSRFVNAVGLANALSMTDDAGASYGLHFSGGGNDREGFHGQLDIVPDLPPGVRWTEIAPQDGPPVRVNLTGTHPAPIVKVTPVARTPGEALLHTYAAIMLGQYPLPLVDVLGDVVAALRVVGALSPRSLVPSQLARLCARQGANQHGIGAEPAGEEDLPEQWRAPVTRLSPTPQPRNCFAAATVALPELDGIRITLTGLVNSATSTTLHAHVSGALLADRGDHLPPLWLRDDHDSWHTTRLSAWGGSGGESKVQLTVWPPLNRAAAVDILACGQTADVRTTMPLIWR
jgi:hypothetical protein